MRREVKSPQRQMRLMAFHVDGTGTAALTQGSTQAALTDNGVGDYSLVYSQSLGRAGMPVATPITADVVCIVSASTILGCTVKCFDATDGTTAKDADFYLHVIGAEVADENA